MGTAARDPRLAVAPVLFRAAAMVAGVALLTGGGLDSFSESYV